RFSLRKVLDNLAIARLVRLPVRREDLGQVEFALGRGLDVLRLLAVLSRFTVRCLFLPPGLFSRAAALGLELAELLDFIRWKLSCQNRAVELVRVLQHVS